MISKVERFVLQQNMWKRGDHIVAGVSGGADSMCLLLVLLELKGKWNLRITAVHVHHGLRGADADRDEAFVRGFCQAHGVPYEAFFVDTAAEAARRRVSEEEAGRELRRERFEAARAAAGADVIALAHHEDDNVETFLFRLCRGSGLEGLCGIRPVSGRIVHPLLVVGRKEIEDFLAARGQEYCTDRTNFEDRYARNRIRSHLIPFLTEELNAKSVSHIARTMRQFSAIDEYLSADLAKLEKDFVIREGDSLRVRRARFFELPAIMRQMLLKDALVRAAGRQRDIGSLQVEQLERLMDGQCGRSVQLLHHVRAERTYDGIRLYPEKDPDGAAHPGEAKGKAEYPAPFSDWRERLAGAFDKTAFGPAPGGYFVRMRLFEKTENTQILEKRYTKRLDYGIIRHGLQLRFRQPGDYLIVDRKGSRQKLKTYFINEKIPKEDRDSTLLLADGSHILWVVGYRMSMAAYITGATKDVLEVRITEDEEDGGNS